MRVSHLLIAGIRWQAISPTILFFWIPVRKIFVKIESAVRSDDHHKVDVTNDLRGFSTSIYVYIPQKPSTQRLSLSDSVTLLRFKSVMLLHNIYPTERQHHVRNRQCNEKILHNRFLYTFFTYVNLIKSPLHIRFFDVTLTWRWRSVKCESSFMLLLPLSL